MTIWEILNSYDKAFTLTLNSYSNAFSDLMWTFFSNQEVWYVLYLAIAVMIIRRLGWRRGVVAIVAIVLTIVVCDQLANFTKNYFHRLRPCWDPMMTSGGLRILEDRGGMYGFYSAHAANAAGFVTCSLRCLQNDRKHNYSTYGRLMTVWFLLVGLSRIFVGKHYFGDVMTGFAVGTAAGLTFGWLTSLLLSRSRLFREPIPQGSQQAPNQ